MSILPSRAALDLDGAQQGWSIPTVVKQSTIPGAGVGRYAQEFTKKGTIMCVKKSIKMADVTSLKAVSLDMAVTFESEADLERYIALAHEEGGHSREAVLDLFANFIWSADGKVAWLNHATWSINHGETGEKGLNVWLYEKDGAIVAEAEFDVPAGAELFCQYRRDFDQPPFYLDYCAKNGKKDVRTMVLEVVD
ncbi:hypothetical protein TeGR_g11832, partial [Tetraparma gracilis]